MGKFARISKILKKKQKISFESNLTQTRENSLISICVWQTQKINFFCKINGTSCEFAHLTHKNKKSFFFITIPPFLSTHSFSEKQDNFKSSPKNIRFCHTTLNSSSINSDIFFQIILSHVFESFRQRLLQIFTWTSVTVFCKMFRLQVENHFDFSSSVFDHNFSFSGIEHNFFRFSVHMLNQTRRQKVVNRGTSRYCGGALSSSRGAWHSNLINIPIVSSVSYFNLGGLELCLGAKPIKAPPSPWRQDCVEPYEYRFHRESHVCFQLKTRVCKMVSTQICLIWMAKTKTMT